LSFRELGGINLFYFLYAVNLSFFVALGILSTTFVWQLGLFSNYFIDISFAICILIFLYYLKNLIQEKFIRRFDKKNIEAPVTQEDA